MFIWIGDNDLLDVYIGYKWFFVVVVVLVVGFGVDFKFIVFEDEFVLVVVYLEGFYKSVFLFVDDEVVISVVIVGCKVGGDFYDFWFFYVNM